MSVDRRNRERQLREEDIISSAEYLFCHKGFDNTSMDEIAEEAQFTKRTLYQYFRTKELLYFEVVKRGFKKLFVYLEDALNGELSGFDQLEQLCRRFFGFYRENKSVMCVISYIGHTKKAGVDADAKIADLAEFYDKLYLIVAKLIQQGIADKSVKGGIDPDKTALSLIFVLTGFFCHLSSVGNTLSEHFPLETEGFSSFTFDMLLNSIKAEE